MKLQKISHRKAAKEEASKENSVNDNKLNISFSIKTPAFASYNNADSVSGTVYSWEIDERSLLKLSFNMSDTVDGLFHL